MTPSGDWLVLRQDDTGRWHCTGTGTTREDADEYADRLRDLDIAPVAVFSAPSLIAHLRAHGTT